MLFYHSFFSFFQVFFFFKKKIKEGFFQETRVSKKMEEFKNKKHIVFLKKEKIFNRKLFVF